MISVEFSRLSRRAARSQRTAGGATATRRDLAPPPSQRCRAAGPRSAGHGEDHARHRGSGHPGYSPARAQEYQRQRVSFQSPNDDSDYSEAGGGQRPGTYAVIAATSVESAPCVRFDVTAHSTVSVRALPDWRGHQRQRVRFPEGARRVPGESTASRTAPVRCKRRDRRFSGSSAGDVDTWRHHDPGRNPHTARRSRPSPLVEGYKTSADYPEIGLRSSAAPARPDSTLSWSSQPAAEGQSPGLFVEPLAGVEEEWTRGVLQQRNTPGTSGRSPAEVVFGRPLRDDLPIHPSRFDSPPSRPPRQGGEEPRAQTQQRAPCREPRSAQEDRHEACRRSAKHWYDQHARDLPEFPVGMRVRVQDERTEQWDRRSVVTQVSPTGAIV